MVENCMAKPFRPIVRTTREQISRRDAQMSSIPSSTQVKNIVSKTSDQSRESHKASRPSLGCEVKPDFGDPLLLSWSIGHVGSGLYIPVIFEIKSTFIRGLTHHLSRRFSLKKNSSFTFDCRYKHDVNFSSHSRSFALTYPHFLR
jgi:hypothetical protein